MKQPMILFTCQIDDDQARERIAKLGNLVEAPELDSPTRLAEAGLDPDVLVVPYTAEHLVTREVIDRLPRLKLIGTTYGGVRQNVDDRYALEKGISVVHTGPTRVRPMAEYTLAMILASLTRIGSYHHCMRSGEAWPRANFGRTRVLHQRAVGIIGYGLIGRGIADLVRNFTDKISIFSRHASTDELRSDGFRKASLDAIFSECEVIVLAGGYTPETHHLIRAEHFEQMQDEALFVNIARGKMVDQAAMVAALQAKNILLALDVFENEPLEENSPLRSSDRVLLAPHRANAPREFEQRWQFLADELERFTGGSRPLTELSVERAQAMSAS